MNPTHYAWPATVLLAQLQPGEAALPSTYLTQAEGFLNQWVCQARVSHLSWPARAASLLEQQ